MASSNFVDYVKIFARSGHGGAGSAHFRREKFVAFGGPDGGDGGKGGSIVLQGDRQYWTLIHLKYQRHQFAEDGQNGSGARSSGRDARDIVIPVPLGTVARRVVEAGGRYDDHRTRGRGDLRRRTARAAPGRPGRSGQLALQERHEPDAALRPAGRGGGEEGAFILELKVLADVGLVGFPMRANPRCCRSSRPRSRRSPTTPSRRSSLIWVSWRSATAVRSSWPTFRASSRGRTKAAASARASCAISSAIRCCCS